MRDRRAEDNPEPKGSHPIGTGIGAGGGAVAGAAIGTAIGGPAGTIVGGAVGAIAGGVGGNAIAQMVNPEEEDTYWREQYVREPYYKQGTDFDRYGPAYRVGYLGRVKYDGRRYDEIEDELAADYARDYGNDLAWDEVRPATRAAWDRVDRRIQEMTRN